MVFVLDVCMEFDNLVFVRELLDLLLIMDFGGENI